MQKTNIYRLRKDLHKRLTALAEDNSLLLPELLNEAVEDWLHTQEKYQTNRENYSEVYKSER
jgi:predicted DNA-binding protein